MAAPARIQLPPLRALLARLDLQARKRLSQNFLLDTKVTDRIAVYAGAGSGNSDDVVIEIGPGPGGLTRSILNQGANHVLAIEKDSRFLPLLDDVGAASNNRLHVVIADALEVDEPDLVRSFLANNQQPQSPHAPKQDSRDGAATHNVHIVGNLPFAVASRLLLKWIRGASEWGQGEDQRVRIASMTLMFQKEVALRVAARPNTRHWTRLSVNSQNVFDTELGFLVSGNTFVPPAKVDAGVVRFVPRASPRVQGVSSEVLEVVCQNVFETRRKTLRKYLSSTFGPQGEEALERSKVDGMLRPEQLTWDDWQRLCLAAIDTELLDFMRPRSKLN